MSALKEIHASLISFKLGLLEKQKAHLEDLCQDVNKVLSDGRDWVDGRNGSEISCEEISMKIEEMIFLLSNKGLESSKTSESPKSSSEEQTLSMEGVSASPQPGESSQSLPTTENLTRAGPTYQTYQSVVGHVTGERIPDYVKKMMSRLDVAELAISSVRGTVDKSSQDLTEVQSQMENLSQNQTQMEENQTQKLADIEKKVKKMGKHSEGMKQQEKRVSSLEKDMEAVKQREKKVTALESEIETMKKQEKRVTNLEKASVAVTSRLNELEEKTFRKINNVETQVQVNTDMIYHVKSRTESLSTRTEDLSNRMDENRSLIDTLSTSRDEDSKKLETLEQKTTNIARKINRYQKTTEKKLDEVKTEFKMVCHMVANRLLPLERLRTILNQKIKGREDNVKKLYDVADKVEDIEQKIIDLGNRSFTTVGFTAYFPRACLTPVPAPPNTITSFTDVKCNIGKYFDSSTGVFTSPCDGLYAVYCTLHLATDGEVNVNVIHKQINPGLNDPAFKLVCPAGTHVKLTSASGFGLVKMSVGDSLDVRVATKIGDVKLGCYSSFSCFRIG